MKKNLHLLLVATALLGMTGASQAATYTFGTNDLLIGFTSGTKDAIVDLGTPTGNTGFTAQTLALASSSFLSGVFGAGWYTNGTVNAAVFGQAASGGVWLNTNSTIPTSRFVTSAGIVSGISGVVNSEYSYYNSGITGITSTNVTLGANTFGMVSYTTAAGNLPAAGGAWSIADQGGWGGNLTSLAENQVLGNSSFSIYYLDPSGAAPWTLTGTKIQFDTLGNLTVANAVPEPSSIALLSLSLILVVLQVRRKFSSRQVGIQL